MTLAIASPSVKSGIIASGDEIKAVALAIRDRFRDLLLYGRVNFR